VYDAAGYIGYADIASNNAVLITGSGSVWSNEFDLFVGYYVSGNSLTIADNSSVVVGDNAYIGYVYTNGGNGIAISGGALSVSSGVLDVRGGALTLNSGSVTVNQLVLTNGANSVFTFSAGTLASGGTFVTNNQVFIVGDGTDSATFQLNGGVHSFADNLEISSNAVLTGCGTIEGTVTIDPGGTVLANCGGMLTFTGIVTNNGTMQAIDGTVLQAYGQVVNNGLINAINGSTDFLDGLVNNGCVLTERDVQSQISNITRSGTNITVQIESAACPTSTYQLQVTPSLKPASWTNLGPSQSGTGSPLTFTDSGGATNRPGRFYRIDITLP
jgi:T5SS/PEP-CTERM-associated repeat protein